MGEKLCAHVFGTAGKRSGDEKLWLNSVDSVFPSMLPRPPRAYGALVAGRKREVAILCSAVAVPRWRTTERGGAVQGWSDAVGDNTVAGVLAQRKVARAAAAGTTESMWEEEGHLVAVEGARWRGFVAFRGGWVTKRWFADDGGGARWTRLWWDGRRGYSHGGGLVVVVRNVEAHGW
ncbi:WGR domain-containing protein [Sesbania bispinosa]|nr:WGR domain-containing protein [Sesbania bispinosa]